MKLSDGEKIIMLMLCNLNDKLEKNLNNDYFVDFHFIRNSIVSKMEWSLYYKFKGLNLQKPGEEDVQEVCSVLEMWNMIEASYTKLSSSDRLRVDKEVLYPAKFKGFGGNNEDKYIKIAEYFIYEIGYYQIFKNRDLDGGICDMKKYRNMLDFYLSIKFTIAYHCRALNVDEIIKMINI